MQTSEILEKNFKRDLKQLLQKYSAEFDVAVEMYEFGAMVQGIQIYIPSSYDEDGELLVEQTTIQLTKWFDADNL